MHGRGPKLGSYVPLIPDILVSGTFEKIFFPFIWAKMCHSLEEYNYQVWDLYHAWFSQKCSCSGFEIQRFEVCVHIVIVLWAGFKKIHNFR